MELTLAQIAERLKAPLDRGGEVVVRGVAGVRAAGADEIAYVAQARYASDAAESRAAALVVTADWAKPVPMPVIKVPNPEAAFAEIARWFAPATEPLKPGIHPTAVIDPTAQVGPDAHIGAHVVIGPRAQIGARTALMAHVVIGEGVRIGDDCRLYPLSSVREHVCIGSRVIIHNGAVIGSDGFGYFPDPAKGWVKIPQIGIVVVGDDVEIGANVTIDRARFGKTVIGRGVKIDNLVQVAHNVIIGDHCALAAQVGIAGSSMLGPMVQAGGQSGVAGHVTIGERAVLGGRAGVTKDIPPGQYVAGFPAVPQKEFALNQAYVSRLPELKKRVAELEKRIAALEQSGRSH